MHSAVSRLSLCARLPNVMCGSARVSTMPAAWPSATGRLPSHINGIQAYSSRMALQRKLVKVTKTPSLAPRTAHEGLSVAREDERLVVGGAVVEVLSDEAVSFVTGGGRRLTCTCAVGVDVGWLRAALRLGSVRAEGSIPRFGKGEGVVWCLVPTAEQRRAIPDEINLVAAKGVSIVCGKSKLKLSQEGSLRVRGREVVVRGSRSTRIQGGVVRVN